MRIAWVTDLHFNHVQPPQRRLFVESIKSSNSDAIVISGDISESEDFALELERLAEELPTPIYFVLGNHDFYGGTFAGTRRVAVDVCRRAGRLIYLTDSSPVHASERIYVVGDDGWGDATVGNYDRSPVRLNDFRLISDFREAHYERWPEMLRELGHESAERLERKLEAIPKGAKSVLVVTHVPPFREACWYQGQTANDDWAPFFVCGAIGNALRRFCESRPDVDVVVLCGHTHHSGVARLCPNLVVHTGRAEYGVPRIEGWIEIRAESLDLQLNSPESD